MKKNLVLLVNADGQTEALVRAATAAGGQVLRIATSSPEAFEIAASEIAHLGLAILDLDPGFRGVPLLTAFEIAHVPTITLTSVEDASVRAIALKHGALSCSVKPVKTGWIKQALDCLMPIVPHPVLALAA
jgi:DNA-binding response OmpR family regulator